MVSVDPLLLIYLEDSADHLQYSTSMLTALSSTNTKKPLSSAVTSRYATAYITREMQSL